MSNLYTFCGLQYKRVPHHGSLHRKRFSRFQISIEAYLGGIYVTRILWQNFFTWFNLLICKFLFLGCLPLKIFLSRDPWHHSRCNINIPAFSKAVCTTLNYNRQNKRLRGNITHQSQNGPHLKDLPIDINLILYCWPSLPLNFHKLDSAPFWSLEPWF
jgi:hypothetical protein